MSVAIVMATYNGEKYIAQQIDSIIAQTHQDWQLLVHDDGSSDSTMQIVAEYEKQDSRIRLIDDGVQFHNSSANFIHLLKNVDDKAEYICLCDEDDVWEVNKIETCLCEMRHYAEKHEMPVCVCTDMCLIDADGNKYVDSFWSYAKVNPNSSFASLLIENTATGCTMMFNRTVLNYVRNLTDKEVGNIIQHDWYIALVCASDGVYRQLQCPLVCYRQHGSNVVGARKTSILDKLSPAAFASAWRRIKTLKIRARRQSFLVAEKIHNVENKNVSACYADSRALAHLFYIFRFGIYKSISPVKAFLKLVLY